MGFLEYSFSLEGSQPALRSKVILPFRSVKKRRQADQNSPMARNRVRDSADIFGRPSIADIATQQRRSASSISLHAQAACSWLATISLLCQTYLAKKIA